MKEPGLIIVLAILVLLPAVSKVAADVLDWLISKVFHQKGSDDRVEIIKT